MCFCTPGIRTPCCGQPLCVPTSRKEYIHEDAITDDQYKEAQLVQLELHLRSCLAQLRKPSSKATFFSHLIRLSDENSSVRETFRTKLSDLME